MQWNSWKKDHSHDRAAITINYHKLSSHTDFKYFLTKHIGLQFTYPGSIQEQFVQIPRPTQNGGGNVKVGLTRPRSSRWGHSLLRSRGWRRWLPLLAGTGGATTSAIATGRGSQLRLHCRLDCTPLHSFFLHDHLRVQGPILQGQNKRVLPE